MRARYCRICAREVLDTDRGWIRLEGLGKFWVCDEHRTVGRYLRTENVGFVYVSPGIVFVLGPYPYEPDRSGQVLGN